MTRLAPVFGPLDKAAAAVIETSRSDLRVKKGPGGFWPLTVS